LDKVTVPNYMGPPCFL